MYDVKLLRITSVFLIACTTSVINLVCLTCLWQNMVKTILNEVASIVIVGVKSYCRILVLVVMVTVRQSFPAVTYVVAAVNGCGPAVNLSLNLYFPFLAETLKSCYCLYFPHFLSFFSVFNTKVDSHFYLNYSNLLSQGPF